MRVLRHGAAEPETWQLVHPDLTDLRSLEARLTGFDACFFLLGDYSAGMTEADYRRMSFDLTARGGDVARALLGEPCDVLGLFCKKRLRDEKGEVPGERQPASALPRLAPYCIFYSGNLRR